MNISLDDAAGVLKVHPRTVLRALAGDVNTYWAEGHNPTLKLAEVALAYGAEMKALTSVLKKRDELLKPSESAEYLGLSLRIFRYREYPVAIQTPGVVRYSKREIARYDVETYG